MSFIEILKMDKLKKLGWIEVSGPPNQKHRVWLSPPDSLWKNKPAFFSIYDAEVIQEALEPIE